MSHQSDAQYGRIDSMLSEIETLVKVESPTDDKSKRYKVAQFFGGERHNQKLFSWHISIQSGHIIPFHLYGALKEMLRVGLVYLI